MRLHLDLRAADREREGLATDAAQRAARRRFGNATRLVERSREAWGWTFLDRLAQDLRYGVRTLAANPGFTATAVLSLALGIGANTAIFTLIDALMLRSLPVADPHSLVQVEEGGNPDLTNPMWEEMRDRQPGFAGMMAFDSTRFDLTAGGEARYAEGLLVSGGYFQVLGVPAARGRVFTNDDDRHGGGRVGTGGGDQPQLLEAPFRRRSERHRQNLAAEPHGVSGRRRHARMVHRAQRRTRATMWPCRSAA